MNTIEMQRALRESGFLRDSPEDDLSRVAAIAQRLDFNEGELIFREGEIAQNLFVILTGNVSLEICATGVGCRRIMTLVDGDLLSWSSVLEPARLTATARAINRTETAAIDGAKLMALCKDDPALGYALMQRIAEAMAQRLNAARMQLLNVFSTETN